jgi:hypothetical protein
MKWPPRFAALLLLILPLLMSALSLEFKRDQGPYWAANKADPSYYYLLGSLAYATGKPSMCCLTPGVTVQVNGAWVLRLSHLIIGNDNFVSDVLHDPEVYAAILGFEQTLLYAAAMFAAGWIVYRRTQQLELALLMQTPVFFNEGNFLWLSPIAPEALLYGTAILLSALAVAQAVDSGRRRFFWLAFGVLTGVGLATKITYLPAAILPLLLLESWMALIGYLLTAAVSFAAISIPHWETIANALFFWNQLLHRQGLHGSGAEGRPHLADLGPVAAAYFRSDPFFTAMFLLCLCGTVWIVWGKRESPRRLLVALTICELLQIGLASRQFSLRYLSPAYAMLAAHAVVLAFCLGRMGPRAARIVRWGCVVGVALLAAARGSAVHTTARQLREARRDSQHVVLGILAMRPGAVAYYGANSVPFSLHFGNVWVYRAFARELNDLYPKMLFWDAYRRTFENFYEPVAVESLAGCGSVLLRGTPFGAQPMGFSPPDHVSVEELGQFNGEAFYAMTCDVMGAPPAQPAPARPKLTNPEY